jgi:hypothetical protein
MSTPFSRIREVFLDDREPEQALFCTYGLDAEFFEAEILPAVFPQRLALDRQAGSAAGYLHAADRTLQIVPVMVFYDHLIGEGNQLQYVAQRVGRVSAFHAKLILLDYGDRLRAVVSSANLTRSAWTQLLELFVTEDILPGEPHAWAPGLVRFLNRLVDEVPAERRDDVRAFASRLSTASGPDTDSQVMSSWDGPLLARILEGRSRLDQVDVITPFLEGDDGGGVFDVLERFSPRGRLYLATTDSGGGSDRFLVRGPEAKINALVASKRWELMRVHQQWEDDDEEAMLRSLHGKALCLTSGDRARLVIGSANVTRAALQMSPPAGNVELVVVRDTAARRARELLPQASAVEREQLDIDAPGDLTGEDDIYDEGAERWVNSALYWAGRGELELRTIHDAPLLNVRYEERSIGHTTGTPTVFALALRAALYVEVDDGTRSGLVPMIVGDPAKFIPRGTPLDLDLEDFCRLLAGAREIEPVPGDLQPATGMGLGEAGGLIGRGAIPWRRLLAAIQGLRDELEREARFPRGIAFVLANETRLGGLLRRLRRAREEERLLAADYAYALHELLRMLAGAIASLDDQAESRKLVRETFARIDRELKEVTRHFDGALKQQLRILQGEVAL